MYNVKKLIPIVLFSLFSLKCLILGTSWPESLTILSLACVYLTTEYFNHNKKIEEFRIELNKLSENFNSIKQTFEDTRAELNALKVKNFTSSTVLRK
jgi:predicted  nucleic acid-binding Zn-ribbon protein